MIHTELCDLLGIEYPVFQGGMAWIADGKLAAAVSNGGGLGVVAAGNAPADYVRQQIRIAKSLTEKPFGVNIMLMSPFADEVAQVAAEERVAVVTTGAGNPSKYMQLWKDAGIKVIPVVASVAMAKLMTRLGASALIAEGGESGGHVGELTTMVLVPLVCDATTLPVLAAGGIADGRGFAAAMMLGACGVQMGTRFLSAEECSIHPTYKDCLLYTSMCVNARRSLSARSSTVRRCFLTTANWSTTRKIWSRCAGCWSANLICRKRYPVPGRGCFLCSNGHLRMRFVGADALIGPSPPQREPPSSRGVFGACENFNPQEEADRRNSRTRADSSVSSGSAQARGCNRAGYGSCR